MIYKDLFRKVLVEPARRDQVNRLLVLSGYASPTMVLHHTEILSKLNLEINIELIIGMSIETEIGTKPHIDYQLISKEGINQNSFKCFFLTQGTPVHSKIYIWCNNSRPIIAYQGSPNYTINGFGSRQINIVEKVPPYSALQFYRMIKRRTTNCLSSNVMRKVANHERNYSTITLRNRISDSINTKKLPSIKLPLTTLKGDVGRRSGLNWGNRPNRRKNEAYLRIPIEVAKSSFFPELGTPFNVVTDDHSSFICAVAQQQSKALHTPLDNTLLGIYFRKRMGLNLQEVVRLEHLVNYGRKDVTIFKINDENYFLDFAA